MPQIKRLDAWLADQGLTAEEALARGLEPPRELGIFISLENVVIGRRKAREYEQEQFRIAEHALAKLHQEETKQV